MVRWLRVALVPAGLVAGDRRRVGFVRGRRARQRRLAILPSAGCCWAVGWLAWERRERSLVGPLMAAAGVAWFLGSFVTAALYLHRGPLVHALMVYPGARLRRPLGRLVVVAAYLDGAIEPLGASPRRDARAVCRDRGRGDRWISAARSGRGDGRASSRRRERRRSRWCSGSARSGGWRAGTSRQRTLWAFEVTLVVVALGLLGDLLRGRWSQGAVTGLVVDLGELRGADHPARPARPRARRPLARARLVAGGRARLRRRSGPAVRRARRGRGPCGHADRQRATAGSPCWCTTARCSTIPRWSRRSPRRRGSPWATFASRPRCTLAWSSSRPRAGGSSRRRTRSAGDWSASCTTAPSSVSPRCRRTSRRSRTTSTSRAPERCWRDVETQLGAARAELSELARGIHPLGADDRRPGRGARGARPPRAGPGRGERGRRGASPPPSRRPRTSCAPRRSRTSRSTRARRSCGSSVHRDAGRLGRRDRRRRRGRRRPGPRVGPARSRRSRRGARRAAQRRQPSRGPAPGSSPRSRQRDGAPAGAGAPSGITRCGSGRVPDSPPRLGEHGRGRDLARDGLERELVAVQAPAEVPHLAGPGPARGRPHCA